MASVIPRVASVTLRRLFPATLLAATATLAGSAVGNPAVACAAPGEWDVGVYDNCMRYLDQRIMAGDVIDEDVQQNHVMQCCELSGGVWDPNSGFDGACGAPPAVAADTSTAPAPEVVDPDTQPGPQPATTKPKRGPAPQVPTLTFAPAPVG